MKDIRKIIKDIYNRKGSLIAKELRTILLRYSHRLSTEKFDIGKIEGVEYEIPIKPGSSPVYSNPYTASPPEQKIIDDTVEVLLKYGLISPYVGEWGAPVLITTNSDGSKRLCVDYSRRNKLTLDNSYPCPNIDDKLTEFKGKKVFSKFDITKAFYNIRVKEEDKPNTAFVTKKGSYIWNVMPFGGKNCPATWARASDWVFRNLPDLIKYIDDIAIASETDEDHFYYCSELMVFDQPENWTEGTWTEGSLSTQNQKDTYIGEGGSILELVMLWIHGFVDSVIYWRERERLYWSWSCCGFMDLWIQPYIGERERLYWSWLCCGFMDLWICNLLKKY